MELPLMLESIRRGKQVGTEIQRIQRIIEEFLNQNSVNMEHIVKLSDKEVKALQVDGVNPTVQKLLQKMVIRSQKLLDTSCRRIL